MNEGMSEEENPCKNQKSTVRYIAYIYDKHQNHENKISSQKV